MSDETSEDLEMIVCRPSSSAAEKKGQSESEKQNPATVKERQDSEMEGTPQLTIIRQRKKHNDVYHLQRGRVKK